MSEIPAAPPAVDVVIGLEVHAQLATQTKIFCGCPTSFGAAPNTQICPVCCGFPGTLPVLNRKAFELGLRAVVALDGKINKRVKFDRKNYFYPDLPKGYQISQYDQPIGIGGSVEIAMPEIAGSGGTRRINLIRLHLEEDAGKLIHDAEKGSSHVDLNRAGTPLAEIVSEPELKSPEEAHAYLVNLKAILKAIGVSEANMEKGHLRCDANVSVRKSPKDPLGTRVEIKNLNSFKYVRSALRYEIQRQAGLVLKGESVTQETRLWDDAAGRTVLMRSKEQAHDYRYFPDPDLVPFEVDPAEVEKIRAALPELPKQKKIRFKEKYKLGDYDTDLILQDEEYTALFEGLAKEYPNYKNLANWLTGPLFGHLNETSGGLGAARFDRAGFLELMKAVDDGTVSLKAAREVVFPEWLASQKSPRAIVAEKGLGQISDRAALDAGVEEAIRANEKSVNDYLAGKENALMFLVGQVMRASKGKANPNLVNEMVREKLASQKGSGK